MSDGVVREWCRKFKDERKDICNAGGQGQKFVATDFFQEVNLVIQEKWRFHISQLCVEFPEKFLDNLFAQ